MPRIDVPSEHELRTVAEAFSTADPFSYSPVFFWRSGFYAGRVAELIARALDEESTVHQAAGWCASWYEYYELSQTLRFQVFVSLFCKGVLHTSDVVPCEPQDSDGPMAVSKRMFRDEEWCAEARVAVDATRLRRLADELMALALISDVQDHAFYCAKQDTDCPGGLVVSGSESNLLFARDGRFAIFDLEPLCRPATLDVALRFTQWSDFSPASVPDAEMSFGSLRRYFRFEDSTLKEIFLELRQHYIGEEGARLFSAIVRRSGILGPNPSEESIREYHTELLTGLGRWIDAMDSGKFYPWLRGLLGTQTYTTIAA